MLCCQHLWTLAQTQTSYYLRLDKDDILISNFSIVDSTLAARSGSASTRNILHFAYFDITVDDQKVTKAVLSKIQNMASSGQLKTVFFFQENSATKKIDVERTFNSAIVREISFPQLDASGRGNLFKLRFKIEAEATSIIYDSKKEISYIAPKVNSKKASTASFNLVLDKLPTRRVYSLEAGKISVFQFGGKSRKGEPEPQVLKCTIASIDEQLWNAHYGNGAKRIISEAYVELLAADLKTVILVLKLNDTIITGYRTLPTVGNTVAKSVYDLEASKIEISTEVK